MSQLTNIPREQFVKEEFTGIASRYELMNQIMTFGMVNHWRRLAIEMLDIQPGQTVVDLGAGGGQLTELAAKVHPDSRSFPSELTMEMMQVGRPTGLPFSAVDALALPYADASVDRLICAFLLRNLEDYRPALGEILRILKPGGIFVSLDTTPPALAILRPFIRLYMRIAIPLIGALVTGRFGAYEYLIRSTERFTPAPLLADHLRQAGFAQAQYRLMLFGTAAIHRAVRERKDDGS